MSRISVLYGKGKGYKVYEGGIEFIEKRIGVNWNNVSWDGCVDVKDLETDNELVQKLSSVLSSDKFSFDSKERLAHSVGKASLEIAELKNGDIPDVVDAVVFPDYDDLPPLLKMLRENKIKAVIFGGGSSVTGGLKFKRSGFVISINSSKLKKLEIRGNYASVGAGFNGAEIEDILNSRNFTIGNFPESLKHSTVGGWVATKATGQESNEYGDIESMLLSVRIQRSDGMIEDIPTPRESGGLMAKDISLGSEGNYGIITDVTVKLYRSPKKRYFKAYFFRSFAEGMQALENLGSIPSVTRLSDELETELALRNSKDSFGKRFLSKYLDLRRVKKGAMLIVMNNDKRISDKFPNGVSVGSIPAEMWYRERFQRPYIANELWMRGVIADTLETSSTWENMSNIYLESIKAFHRSKEELKFNGEIMAHISHIYRTGACIYFTFLMKSENEVKDLIKVRSDLIGTFLKNGGSITHHHGLGKYFLDYLNDAKKEMHSKLIDPVFDKGLYQ